MSKTAQRKRTLRQQAQADARRGYPFKSHKQRRARGMYWLPTNYVRGYGRYPDAPEV